MPESKHLYDKACESVTWQIQKELQRQIKLQQEGRFPYVAYDLDCPDVTRLAMLTEEVGEVARAMQEVDFENLKDELVQIASIAVSWAARLEKDDVRNPK